MEANKQNKVSFNGSIVQQIWGTTDFAVKTRLINALEQKSSQYPVFRELRFAARTNLQDLFDELALNPDWASLRVDTRSLFLENNVSMVSARGSRKSHYCSCHFSIWANSVEAAEQVKASIEKLVEDVIIKDPMFSINWHFLTSRQELENTSIEELANDQLFDQAYPDLEQGVENFIKEYVNADETVLVLQGPPGTGKTRLIRAILGQLSRTKDGTASALYTGDKKTLESDEIFVRFITGWEDAFVVEDADHLLKPRAEGNEHLHRFLTIADGVVRSQGRKIIFSTNLPNVGDLDDALIRPGRCFARVSIRELSFAEAVNLIEAMCKDKDIIEKASHTLHERRNKTYSLAEVYKTLNDLTSL